MAIFPNKYGHFSDDGKEYIITRSDTPMPWVNVISNGARSKGTTTVSDGTLTTKVEGTNSDGENMSFETPINKVDADTFTSQRLNIVVSGEARNDWPVGTYKRVK